MSDLYFCNACGYVLIFRNIFGDPHHPIHIPTGWPCWNMEGTGPTPIMRIPITTPRKNREKLLREGSKLVEEYKKKKESASVSTEINRKLNAQQKREARSFLRFLNQLMNSRPYGSVTATFKLARDRWETLLNVSRSKRGTQLKVRIVAIKEPLISYILKIARQALRDKRNRDMQPILQFVKKQLRYKRNDVVGLLLRSIAISQDGKSKELVVFLIKSEAWQYFLKRFPKIQAEEEKKESELNENEDN